LDYLKQNPELRHRVGAAAYRYVSEHRTESAGAARRYKFYRSLVSHGNEAGALTTELIRTIPQLRQGEGERHFLHEFSASEQAAYEGLVSEFNWKDREHAHTCYKRALELEPTFFQARYYLGNFLLTRNPAAAADELRQSLAIEPSSAHAAHLLALSLWRCDQSDYALAVLRALQCTHPLYAPGFELEAQLLVGLNRPDEAVRPLHQSLEANPFYSPALVHLGVLCLEVDQPTEAERFFRQALELVPNSARICWGLAVALQAQGRESEALDRCLDAIRIDSSGTPAAEALVSIALRYAKAKDINRAVEVLSRGLEVAPSHPDLLVWHTRIVDNNLPLEGLTGTGISTIE
jgi:tetratricopeptide (TPR) repeat protein